MAKLYYDKLHIAEYIKILFFSTKIAIEFQKNIYIILVILKDQLCNISITYLFTLKLFNIIK